MMTPPQLLLCFAGIGALSGFCALICVAACAVSSMCSRGEEADNV